MMGKILVGAAGLGGIYVASTSVQSDPGMQLKVPLAYAMERLADSHRIVNGTGMGSLKIAGGRFEDGARLINITRAGNPRPLHCRVKLAAVTDDTSRADIDCAQPKVADQALRQIGEKALGIVVSEHVAATVEGRDYDIDGVADRMIGLVAMNSVALAATIHPPE